MLLERYNSAKIRIQPLGEGTPLELGTCSANPKQCFEIVKNGKRFLWKSHVTKILFLDPLTQAYTQTVAITILIAFA